jgi:hypothetical protein
VGCWRKEMELRRKEYQAMAGVLDLLNKKGKGKKEVVNYEALEEEFEVIYWK